MLRPTAWIRRLPPATPLLAGVGLLVLVVVLSATGESAVEVGQGWMPRFDRSGGTPEERREALREDDFETPPILRAVAAFGLVILLLAMAVMVLIGLVAIVLGMHFERRRRQKLYSSPTVAVGDDESGIHVDLIRRAAGGALDRLLERAGGDPGDAVVAAWLTLEESAAECGLPRKPHQTPTEFTSAVLSGLRVDAAALDRLRLLYQRARFSSHRATEDDVRVAAEVLRRIVTDLGPVSAHAGAGPRSPA